MNKALSPIYEMADSFAMTTSRSFFLTGKAGTGKTTFLKNLRLHTRKQTAVVAPTGVAAINAGGMTIHSFFQLPFTPFVPTPEGRLNLVKKLHVTRRKRKVMQELELLVIDEVSMVRADIMDEIDTVLRHVRVKAVAAAHVAQARRGLDEDGERGHGGLLSKTGLPHSLI